VLAVGDRFPEASIWTAPRERRPLSEFVADGPALFLFFLFAWSST
jgi:hypothetical protein